MKILLIEGQPGSGKTTYSQMIAEYLSREGVPNVYVDEHMQDATIFGDYWELELPDWVVVAENLFLSWRQYIETHVQQSTVHVFDNSLLNQMQYMLILNASHDAMSGYFQKVCRLFSRVEAAMIFLEGESEVVTKRADRLRTNGWGDRVAALLEGYPYQRDRNRTGRKGMIDFFRDSQVLKKELIADWPDELAQYDTTAGECADRMPMIIQSLLRGPAHKGDQPW